MSFSGWPKRSASCWPKGPRKDDRGAGPAIDGPHPAA